MFEEEMHTHSSIQERVNMLKDQGYRGFRLFGGTQQMEASVQVHAKNKNGLMLNAKGDTLDEAYENLIETIDYTLDDRY